MVSNPRKPWPCLAFIAGLALAALPSVAQVGPAPLPGYSVRGAGTTMTAACSNAIALLNDHCALHGAVTTTSGRCTKVYDPFTGAYLTTICDCTASTSICANPFPIH